MATSVLAIVAGLIHFLVAKDGTAYLLDLGYNHDSVRFNAHVWRYTVLNLLFASVILVLLSQAGRASAGNRFLESSILVNIGRVSYGMYIFHWLIYVYIFARLFPVQHLAWQILLFIPYLAAVYGVAALSYRFYESWFLKWKDRLYTRTSPVGTEKAAR